MKTIARKVVLSAAILLLAVIALFSCEFPLFPSNDSGVEYKRIVIAEDSVKTEDLSEINSAISNLQGPISIVTDDEDAIDGEIVFGDADRDITEKAKAKMEARLKEDGATFGYIVYAEGNNVAVYWTDEDMRETAISIFLTECIEKSELKLDAGVVLVQGYATNDDLHQKYWIALEAQGCPEDTLAALKELNKFYNGSVYCEWMANLWDDDIGGFYYSNSARNNEPFRPDLESTYQLIGWITGHGASGGLSKNDFFPPEMKQKMVKFAQDMQSEDNGYFYHPQWGTSVNVDRYGRDLSWATSIIKNFDIDTDGDGIEEDQYPYWCAPDGTKCKEHAENGGICNYGAATLSVSGSGIATACVSSADGITVSLREGVLGAVYKVRNKKSQVIATASSTPDYSSSAAFTQWLWDFNGGLEGMLNSSGRAHDINALQAEIIGNGFGDEVVAFLDDAQQQIIEYQQSKGETPTYLWQATIDYNAAWGVLKYMPFYNDATCGKALPLDLALNMIRSCIKVVELKLDPNLPPKMNDMMNQWASIGEIINNIKKHHGDGAAEQAYEIVRENAVYCIKNSIDKLTPYKLNSGIFAYTYARRSLSTIYGVSISHGTEEGDVNGSILVCSMYANVFAALGYGLVPLCTEADGVNFLRIIQNLDPIEKVPIPVGKAMDFEDGDVPSGITSAIGTREYSLSVEEDPSDSSNYTLCFKSGDGTGAGDNIKFPTTGEGSCYIFETKIYFKDMGSSESGKDIFQARLANLYMLTFGYVGNKVYAGYRTHTDGGDTDTSFAVGEIGEDGWCKIRLELYYPDTNEDGELKVKFFINDEYKGTDNHHWLKHQGADVNTSHGVVDILSRRDFKTEIYLDDCFFNIENKTYDPQNHDISDSRDN